MEENVLIKSATPKKTKKIYIYVVCSLLACAIISLILGIIIPREVFVSYRGVALGNGYDRCRYCNEEIPHITMLTHIADHHLSFAYEAVFYDGIVGFILNWVCLFLAGIISLIYLSLTRCNITVTDKNIYGQTYGGKKVTLPIHMISAYSTNEFFATLTITSASGCIKFPCIENYEEIAKVLQEIINERQEKTEVQQNASQPQTNNNLDNNLDNLLKLKSLLDNGIITQEEFDAKKKDLLGM